MIFGHNQFRNKLSKYFSFPMFKFLVLFLLIFLVVVYSFSNSYSYHKSANPVIKTIRDWKSFISAGVLNFGHENCNYEDYVFGTSTYQTDPCLIAAFKRKFLIPPPSTKDINREPLANVKDIPSNIEKLEWVEKLLIKNPRISDRTSSDRRGFYIECGANDGSFISPTIRLEKLYNWTGLLIEANPAPFQTLLKKKRNAYAVNAAVCTKPYPEKISFFTNPSNTGMGGLNERDKFGVNVKIEMQCIPLFTMLAALDLKIVDYLSLDVEGLELEILKTFLFDRIQFQVMTIEHWSIPGGKQALRHYLEPKGYKFVKVIEDSLTKDSLYVHESLYEDALQILKHRH